MNSVGSIKSVRDILIRNRIFETEKLLLRSAEYYSITAKSADTDCIEEVAKVRRKLEESVNDKLARHIELCESILKHFECRRCFNCCTLNPRLILADIIRLDEYDEFLMQPAENGEGVNMRCLFLSARSGESFCRIYPERPLNCRLFPFNVTSFSIQRINICPMAYDIYEFIEANMKRLLKIARKFEGKYEYYTPVDIDVNIGKIDSLLHNNLLYLSIELEEAMAELLRE